MPLGSLQQDVVLRLIHSSGDPELAGMVRFAPGACEAGLVALAAGAPILTDTAMAAAAVAPMARRTFGNRVMSVLEWAPELAPAGATRAAAGMAQALAEMGQPSVLPGAAPVVLIGSAHGVSMPLGGFALTVAAAVMWAGGNIVSRSLGRFGPMDQQAFVVWASLVPPLPFLALSLWLEGPQAMASAILHFQWQSLAALAYLAWAATLFGYGVWTRMLSRYPANRVAPFSLLVPLVGLTTGWLVFGEVLQPVHFAGGALLMAGLLLNLFGARWLGRKTALAVP